MACPLYKTNQIRQISQMALERLKTVPSRRLFWKTDEDDPRNHNETHLGLFYQMPEEKKIIQIYGYPSPFRHGMTKFYKLWGRMRVMVRQPALSAMAHIRNSNQQDQNTKLLLYGGEKYGKSHTLAHLVHFLHLHEDRFIVQIRDIRKFAKHPIETKDSTSRTGRIDTPLDAALLLQQIRTVNADLFEKYKDILVCGQDYQWSIREVTKAGEPLTKVADHGVNRVNHASDCAAVLLKELMLAANEGKIKLATIVNDLKWLYKYEAGELKHADFRRVIVDELTIARAIKKLVQSTGKGSLLLASCEDTTNMTQHLTPKEILQEEAMKHLDGCTQIHVPKYSKEEFDSAMNYYQDIGWLCRPESRTQEARDELRFVSGSVPGHLEYLCRAI